VVVVDIDGELLVNGRRNTIRPGGDFPRGILAPFVREHLKRIVQAVQNVQTVQAV
jgi:hypothetical protein